MNPAVSRGMTLIEMLVVLLIMGLLVSVTVLSTGVLRGSDSKVPDSALIVAEDLSRLFTHAGQQALAKNEVWGWSIVEAQGRQDMRWWRWSSGLAPQPPGPNTQRTAAWLQADDAMMTTLTLPNNIELHLNTESRSDAASTTPAIGQENNYPVVVFFPGREYSGFEIVVRDAESGRALARIWPERDGQINWGPL